MKKEPHPTQLVMMLTGRLTTMLRHNDILIQDLRYGARTLRNSPSFTIIVVLSLAIGIGATTATFSLIDAVMLKMLPVKDPEQLYFLKDIPNAGGHEHSLSKGPTSAFAYGEYEVFRDHNEVFSGLLAYRNTERISASYSGQAEMVEGKVVSGDYYSVLGVNMVLGQGFNEEEATHSGTYPVVVISYQYWQRRFGDDTSVIGKTINLNNTPFTIIGVTPPEFFGLEPGVQPDVTVPIMMIDKVTRIQKSDLRTLPLVQIVGRLRSDIDEKQALSNLSIMFHRVLNERVSLGNTSSEKREEMLNRKLTMATASKGLSWTRERISNPLLVIMVISGIILLIACANTSILTLSRDSQRQKEIAVRQALGASHWRLIRQLLNESILLATLGGVGGVFIAYLGARFLLTGLGNLGPTPLRISAGLDLRVLGFSLAVSGLCGILFGLIPAFRATKLDLVPMLKENASGSIGGKNQVRSGKILIVLQVALSLILLITASSFIRTFQNLKRLNLGFIPEGLLLATLDPTLVGYKEQRLSGLYKELQERLNRIPGVHSASLSTFGPIGQVRGIAIINVPGYQPRPTEDSVVNINKVGPGYFETLGIPLISGRSIGLMDIENAPRVAIINRTMAGKYFPGEDPVGKKIALGTVANTQEIEIVGIVEDSKYSRVQEAISPTIYTPFFQSAAPGKAILEIRASVDTRKLIATIRREVEAIDRNVPIFNIKTAVEQINESLSQERLVTLLSSFFGLVALFLICIGLFGIFSYEVERRANEIGLRLALGAGRWKIIWRIMREAILLVLAGVAIGLLASLLITPFFAGLLLPLTLNDPITLAMGTLITVAVAVSATYVPARRASCMNPAVLLRRQ